MSGLYLLVVIAIWVALGALLLWIWRRWPNAEGGKRHIRNTFGIVVGTLWCGTTFWYAGGQQTYYDMQVNRMCKLDGGNKIYETVKLSKIEYDEYAKKNWILPAKDRSYPEGRFYMEMVIHYYRDGNPKVSRRQYRIVRRSDNKVLGESVYYGRGGGGLPGPWHGSSFSCPQPTTQPSIETSVFVRDQ